MSTHESERNSSQDKQQSRERDNSIEPKVQRSPDNRRPMPFDDDDHGSAGSVADTSNPKIDGMGGSENFP